MCGLMLGIYFHGCWLANRSAFSQQSRDLFGEEVVFDAVFEHIANLFLLDFVKVTL